MDTPPSAPVQVVPTAPNTAYDRRLRNVRARSVSPRLRRAILLSSLSVAQQRARTAEQMAESAFSNIGVVVDETHCVRSIVEAAIAEARSVRDEVSSRIAEFAKRADISASSAIGMLTGQMQEMIAQTEVRASRVDVDVK